MTKYIYVGLYGNTALEMYNQYYDIFLLQAWLF